MSRYIPNKNGGKSKRTKANNIWTSRSFSEPAEFKNPLASEKERIESIPLEQLTFKDLYQFPFRQCKYSKWVYDNKDNFIFQFENVEKETRNTFIQIINGEVNGYKKQNTTLKNGEIFIDGKNFITIRGWGNLTGIGAYNLEGEYAAKIQDTLAEFIVAKLNRNE